MDSQKRFYLIIIVLSQFFCTSLWFASNGVMDELIQAFDLRDSMLGNLTSAVQLGFISGTLLVAIFHVADRFKPSYVFAISALGGAVFNASLLYSGNTDLSLLIGRFLTGLCLAGIYPIGMKIAADHFGKDLGKSLGYLVGALVLGTALPHLLKNLTVWVSWQSVLYVTSLLACLGGLMMWVFVPEGPLRVKGRKVDFYAFISVFKNKEFRSASFGYFGHMWELYAFWTFVPFLLSLYGGVHDIDVSNVSSYAFLVIGIGGFSCILGGYISLKRGAKYVASRSLVSSMICCLTLPFIIHYVSFPLYIFFLLFWGMVVISDSPMFSTLVAQSAPKEKKGTALTIVNCLGFSISILSIQTLTYLTGHFDTPSIFMILAIGPIVGIVFQYR